MITLLGEVFICLRAKSGLARALLYETSGILFADGERALIYYEAFLWHVLENTMLACVRALF
jgi:hypothetical protein